MEAQPTEFNTRTFPRAQISFPAWRISTNHLIFISLISFFISPSTGIFSWSPHAWSSLQIPFSKNSQSWVFFWSLKKTALSRKNLLSFPRRWFISGWLAGGYKYIFELCCHGCHLGGFERKWNNGLTLDIGGVQPGAFLGLMENLSVIPRVQWVGFSQEPVEVTKHTQKRIGSLLLSSEKKFRVISSGLLENQLPFLVSP